MFHSRRPKELPKLRQKLADAAVSLAEAAASEEGSSEGEREPPLAVDLQAHPDPVRGAVQPEAQEGIVWNPPRLLCMIFQGWPLRSCGRHNGARERTLCSLLLFFH